MSHRTLVPSIALALGLALGACGGGDAEESAAPADTTPVVEAAPVSVTGVTMGRAIGPDGRVTDATTTFAPGDTIYASVETEGTADAATLTALWSYEDGQVVNESNRTIAPDGPANTEFHVSKPDGWPAGGYEVVISLDGAEAGRASFEVQE